jgi:plastocyanin
MNNTLDSRFLQFGNTFTQRFSQAGKVPYSIGVGSPTTFLLGPLKPPFSISVRDSAQKGSKGKQHRVRVFHRGGSFQAEPPHLEIETGDAVTWSCLPKTPPFSIRGGLEGFHFDSAAITQYAAYTHPFGVAGEYEWVDANGSGLRGRVNVHEPKLQGQRDFEQFRKQLTAGVLVTVRGEKAEPETVDIAVGQTVFWAIESARGITITDGKLLREITRPEVSKPRRRK